MAAPAMTDSSGSDSQHSSCSQIEPPQQGLRDITAWQIDQKARNANDDARQRAKDHGSEHTEDRGHRNLDLGRKANALALCT